MLGLLMYEVFEAERGLFLSLSGLILGSPKWSSLFHHCWWFVLRFREYFLIFRSMKILLNSLHRIKVIQSYRDRVHTWSLHIKDAHSRQNTNTH
jgi:hypothetical protein